MGGGPGVADGAVATQADLVELLNFSARKSRVHVVAPQWGGQVRTVHGGVVATTNNLAVHVEVTLRVAYPHGGGQLRHKAHEPGVIHLFGSTGLTCARPVKGSRCASTVPLHYISQGQCHLVGVSGVHNLTAGSRGDLDLSAVILGHLGDGGGRAVGAVSREGGVNISHGNRGYVHGAQHHRGVVVDFPAINRGYTQILSQTGDRAQVHTAKHVYVANVYRQGSSVNNRVVNVF